MTNELIDLYEENEKLALQSSLFRRKTLCKNEKRHEQMSKELDNLIKEGKASSTHAERLLRNIRIVEEMIGKQKGEIPDIDVQYKNLLKLLKEKHPEELNRMQSSLSRKLREVGALDADKPRFGSKIRSK